MPLENRSGEPDLGWMGEGLARSLAMRLEALGMRTVTPAERFEAMEGVVIPTGSTVTLATSLRAAESARAGRMVTGSFSPREGGGAVLEARLIDTRKMRVLWKGTLSGSLAEIFRLTDTLALEAAARDPGAGGGAERLEGISDPPPSLHRILVLAQSAPRPEERLSLLRRGLSIDGDSPDLRRALALAALEGGEAGLALSFLEGLNLSSFPDAWRAHLLKARALAALARHEEASSEIAQSIGHRESAEAHLMLAARHAGEGDMVRAKVELELAEGLDPGHPEIPALRSRVGGESP